MFSLFLYLNIFGDSAFCKYYAGSVPNNVRPFYIFRLLVPESFMIRTVYLALLLLTGIGVCSSALAQQDPQFSLYMFNPVYFNPAAVGSEGVTRFQLTHRTQYAGYQGSFDDGGAPSTQLFSFNMPLTAIRGGIGLYAFNDRLGPAINQAVNIAYAFRLPIKTGTLALGVEGGLYNRGINYDILRPGEPDPILPTGRVNSMQPDVSLGAQYSTSTFNLGASLKHLTRPSFGIGTNDRNVAPLSQAVYINAGYRYEWNYTIDIMPSILYKYQIDPDPSFPASSFEVSLLAMYDKRYWAGFSYRQSDAIMATIGLSLMRNNALRFGYAFDFVTGNQVKSIASHEVLLSYSLPAPGTGRKPIVRTPRFRY